jgi:DNA-binding transcriptional regulator YiaG
LSNCIDGAYDMVMLTDKDIKKLRKALGLTALEFGDLLGVKQITVFQWESGRRHPKFDMLVKLNKIREEALERGLVQSA